MTKSEIKTEQTKPITEQVQPVNDLDTIEDKIETKIIQKAKKYGFSARTIKHLETLEKYYKIDVKRRVITIPLHFKNVYDIIEEGVGTGERPIIQRSLLSKISSLAHSIPYEFRIDIDLKIDKYEGYEHSVIAKALLDAFEIFHYDLSKKKVNNNLKMIVLIVLGVLIFAWLFYICSKNWFSEKYVHDTVHEIIYTVAAVFIWESVYMAFLYDNSFDGIAGNLLKRIHHINLYDAKSVLLYKIKNRDMKETWSVDNRAQDFARRILFLAATALLCLSGCKAIDMVEIFIKYRSSGLAVSSAVLTFIKVILSVLGGIGAISYYRDKGPFKKFLLPFAILDILMNLADIIISIFGIIDKNQLAIKSLVISCIALVLAILFLIAILILRKRDKSRNNLYIQTTEEKPSK